MPHVEGSPAASGSESSGTSGSTRSRVRDQQEENSRTSESPTVTMDQQGECNGHSQAADASALARQRRRIAQLEERLEAFESGRTAKERYGGMKIIWLTLLTFCRQSNYFMAQGRAIRRVVTLFDNVEDLVTENDRRHEDDDEDTNVE
jgi:hypothetical protein